VEVSQHLQHLLKTENREGKMNERHGDDDDDDGEDDSHHY
jgi:hypothetical protein